MVTWIKFQNDGTQILGTTLKNLVSTATWSKKVLHSCPYIFAELKFNNREYVLKSIPRVRMPRGVVVSNNREAYRW